MRGDDAWRHSAGSGKPRLIVFSQARWSRNDGGENCLLWARSGLTFVTLPWTGPRGHMRNTFSRSDEPCRGIATARRSCASDPFAWRQAAAAATTWRSRERRAAGRIGFTASFQSGPRTGSSQVRPSSPSGCLVTFDVAMSRTLPGRFGRSPYFRHRRLLRRSLRPHRRTRRINSLYQCSVTVGADPTERACGRRPCRCGIPCVQLVASLLTG